mmetsp:Transcript_51084/g.114786  ORF Transcript_51084/g.114786 Transcript_51084/m.114786 type:complete len:143 (+) Transcript_51084:154-582(+)
MESYRFAQVQRADISSIMAELLPVWVGQGLVLQSTYHNLLHFLAFLLQAQFFRKCIQQPEMRVVLNMMSQEARAVRFRHNPNLPSPTRCLGTGFGSRWPGQDILSCRLIPRIAIPDPFGNCTPAMLNLRLRAPTPILKFWRT